VFIKLWSATVRQVARDVPQAVSEEKALNEWKIQPYVSVLKWPLLLDLQQKVGELVISTTF
jgi:hypothetical protein